MHRERYAAACDVDWKFTRYAMVIWGQNPPLFPFSGPQPYFALSPAACMAQFVYRPRSLYGESYFQAIPIIWQRLLYRYPRAEEASASNWSLMLLSSSWNTKAGLMYRVPKLSFFPIFMRDSIDKPPCAAANTKEGTVVRE